jgi:hypothetical protein
MRTIIGLLIFAALLWVALNWSLFSILFMALMLVIAIAVVRMSHHVSPIDFYRIGFAIRTGTLLAIGFVVGIIRWMIGMLILCGVLWSAGWLIGEIKDWTAKPAVEATAAVTPAPDPEEQRIKKEIDVVFQKMEVKDQVFNECVRLHDNAVGTHDCMVAEHYILDTDGVAKGFCKTLSSLCYLTGPKRIKQ